MNKCKTAKVLNVEDRWKHWVSACVWDECSDCQYGLHRKDGPAVVCGDRSYIEWYVGGFHARRQR